MVEGGKFEFAMYGYYVMRVLFWSYGVEDCWRGVSVCYIPKYFDFDSELYLQRSAKNVLEPCHSNI